jgi:hypothetical protein
MRTDLVKYALVCGVAMLAGCRFKGIESFETATTPVKFEKAQGDKYSNGGIAYASAGSHVATRYGIGSDPNSPAKVDSKLDRPAKGSGQEAGEEGGEAGAGYGKSNSPVNQPKPSVDSANSH